MSFSTNFSFFQECHSTKNDKLVEFYFKNFENMEHGYVPGENWVNHKIFQFD